MNLSPMSLKKTFQNSLNLISNLSKSPRPERIVSDLLTSGFEIDYNIDGGIYVVLDKEDWLSYRVLADYAIASELALEYMEKYKRYVLY